MKKCTLLALMIGLAVLVQQTEAQEVPYRVTGTGIGNFAELTAVGEAIGLHFGRLTYQVFDDGTDTQVASDGSKLYLLNVGIIAVVTSEPDSDGLVQTLLIDEWMITGGTKRFSEAQPVEVDGKYIISTVMSAPYNPADPTAVPFEFQKLGKIDLGRRRGKN